MANCVLQIMGFANGAPCPVAGQYLVSFDFEANDGRGSGHFSDLKVEAKKFATVGDALIFWKTQSKVRPFRLDGKPNRPLISSHMRIEPVE